MRKISAPKWISYALWAVAGFRLAVPFMFEIVLSLLPIRAVLIPVNLASMEHIDVIQVWIVEARLFTVRLEKVLTFSRTSMSVRPYREMTEVISNIWLIGAAAMLVYAVISYIHLSPQRQHINAVRLLLYPS
ncbi:MAG: hypothetical protein LBU32_30015 [Clostridiales bacterium]|nr:hypothetical protein [Clostridiales bacterium]